MRYLLYLFYSDKEFRMLMQFRGECFLSQTATYSETLLKWTSRLLISTVWVSALLFGCYILTFYASAFVNNTLELWNEGLTGLYDPEKPVGTLGIGIHFATGGIILILGSVQLLPKIRLSFPKFHKTVGKIYVVACILTAIGGLTFIVVNGTIGGIVMNIGFSIYGILMLLCAVQTARYAMLGKLNRHGAWALRLYALAIGSWLYRMDYGFWLLLADGLGHTKDFRGIFDTIMSFFFYVPNLIVAEIFIRRKKGITAIWAQILSSVLLLLASGFLMIGTYYFTLYHWGPAILKWIGV